MRLSHLRVYDFNVVRCAFDVSLWNEAKSRLLVPTLFRLVPLNLRRGTQQVVYQKVLFSGSILYLASQIYPRDPILIFINIV